MDSLDWITCARDRTTKERKREKEGEKREKDDGDVATRVVGEVKQITGRSPLLLYGVHHGVDFQRYNSRGPERRGGLEGGKWGEGSDRTRGQEKEGETAEARE